MPTIILGGRMFRAVALKIIIGAAATAAAVGLTPLAHADQGTYIHMLDTAGVEYSSPTNAMIMGEAVCSTLEEGRSGQQIADAIVHGDFSSKDVGKIVAAAVIGLCPQDKPLMNAAFGTHV
jgi:hypothetical protein